MKSKSVRKGSAKGKPGPHLSTHELFLARRAHVKKRLAERFGLDWNREKLQQLEAFASTAYRASHSACILIKEDEQSRVIRITPTMFETGEPLYVVIAHLRKQVQTVLTAELVWNTLCAREQALLAELSALDKSTIMACGV
jgi:3D (Asp-Asp-Asp) domain-containing protein